VRASSPSLTGPLSALNDQSITGAINTVSVVVAIATTLADNSSHDFDVEVRAAELNVHPDPERNEHLQPACCGQVA
jgi:hypothetical protein